MIGYEMFINQIVQRYVDMNATLIIKLILKKKVFLHGAIDLF